MILKVFFIVFLRAYGYFILHFFSAKKKKKKKKKKNAQNETRNS